MNWHEFPGRRRQLAADPSLRPGVAAGIGLALLALAATPVEAQPSLGKDWTFAQLDWRGTVPAEHRVSINNPFGDLRVRGTPGDQIEVLALVQHHEDDPRRFEIVPPEAADPATAGLLHLEIRQVGEVETPDDSWRKRRVDLTVLVPAAAPLQLTTDAGVLQSKGQSAAVVARSAHGDIFLVSDGTVDVRSDYGGIQVELKSRQWSEPPQLRTRTGPIRLRLPAATPFRAELSTQGEITTDYSITIARRPNSTFKDGRIETDPEGPRIVLESQRGDLAILEALAAEAP